MDKRMGWEDAMVLIATKYVITFVHYTIILLFLQVADYYLTFGTLPEDLLESKYTGPCDSDPFFVLAITGRCAR